MTIKILGICGSLRKDSLNRMALNAAAEIGLAQGITFEIAQIRDIPHYDADLQARDFPETVTRLGRQISDADAVLFVSPEYNYSIPGVLKNAVDWISRLPDQPLGQKPVGIMGASMGFIGTARMQYHLRQVLVFLDALPINKPEVMIGGAHQRFDSEGRLQDEATAKKIGELLSSLERWAKRLKAGGGSP